MAIDDEIAEWEKTVPSEITSDVLWRNTAYRLATFAADSIWPDITALAADSRTVRIADQLYTAVGSIGANYAEAYSRGTDRDRCRIYEYALGSAREARDWTYKARHVLRPSRTAELLSLLTRIVQLLTTTIVRERSRNSRLKGISQPRTTEDARSRKTYDAR
jgi:four helix bundle protein